MNISIPFPIALGRFKQLPQRSNDVWQGGLVKLPAWVDNPNDPDGPPYRPTGALWVSLRTGYLHLALPNEAGGADPDLALRALIDFGLKESKKLQGRPSALEVRDQELKDALSGPMSALNTSVRLVEELPAVADALRSLEAAAGDGRRHPGMLEAAGVTRDQLRAFADAAAAFFRAAPWRHLANEDLLVVKTPSIPKAMRHVCVLGNAGEQFGISFFDSRRAFERIYTDPGVYLPKRAFGVTYGPIDDLPLADVDAWEELNLAVAEPHAYPLAADLTRGGEMRRLNATELDAAEALLRTLAVTTEDELDSGSWTRVVQTSAGQVSVELTLPFLIEAEQGRASAPLLSGMPPFAERGSARLARLLADRSFDSLEEANAAIERAEAEGLFDKDPEAAAGRSLTPLEQAQELAYDAMEATGRLRIKLARRALEVSPDCADACVVLGEASATPHEAREWYERAVDAGARAIGADKMIELQGEFWGHLETRPYMRARARLAQTLLILGEEERAVGHYRELLRLNPNDNQGIRYLLLPALLDARHDKDADRLLREYDGDIQAMWPYAKALRSYQAGGDTPTARAALKDAIGSNPHVVAYLLDPAAIPPVAPPHFALGSREEAASVAEALHAPFAATPGAMAWIHAAGARLSDRRGRRSRDRSRRT